MKSIKFTSGIIILAAIFSQSCHKGGMWGIRGKGVSETETRYVTGFNAIDLSIDGHVEYVQDSVYLLTVTGQENIRAILETKVEGGVLKLGYKRNVWSYNELHFVIHSPEMVKITMSGSGYVNVKNHINGTHLALNISGSGNITVPTVSLQNLTSKISGSGNIQVNGGSCTNQDINISGSGDINSEWVNTINGVTKVSGSGHIIINASQKLDVNISGSGNVKYKGNPTISKHISGSGRLIRID